MLARKRRESAREDKGDDGDRGCRSWSQKLFIKPTPPPTHQHITHTSEHTNNTRVGCTRPSPPTCCCSNHFEELKRQIQICNQNGFLRNFTEPPPPPSLVPSSFPTHSFLTLSSICVPPPFFPLSSPPREPTHMQPI